MGNRNNDYLFSVNAVNNSIRESVDKATPHVILYLLKHLGERGDKSH